MQKESRGNILVIIKLFLFGLRGGTKGKAGRNAPVRRRISCGNVPVSYEIFWHTRGFPDAVKALRQLKREPLEKEEEEIQAARVRVTRGGDQMISTLKWRVHLAIILLRRKTAEVWLWNMPEPQHKAQLAARFLKKC